MGKKQAEADGIMTETCATTAGLEGRGRGRKPRMQTASRSSKKARKQILLQLLQKEHSPTNT